MNWEISVTYFRKNKSRRDMSLKSLDEDERSKLNLGRQGKVNIINESGMYTLILRCRDAIRNGSIAHRFRNWVTNEVLPSIRKITQESTDTKHLLTKQEIMRYSLLASQKSDVGICNPSEYRVVNWHP